MVGKKFDRRSLKRLVKSNGRKSTVDTVSPRKLAKPGGRLEGRPTGDKAFFFCDRGLTQASN